MKHLGRLLLAVGAGLLCYFGGNLLAVLWSGGELTSYDTWHGPAFAAMQGAASAGLFYMATLSQERSRMVDATTRCRWRRLDCCAAHFRAGPLPLTGATCRLVLPLDVAASRHVDCRDCRAVGSDEGNRAMTKHRCKVRKVLVAVAIRGLWPMGQRTSSDKYG